MDSGYLCLIMTRYLCLQSPCPHRSHHHHCSSLLLGEAIQRPLPTVGSEVLHLWMLTLMALREKTYHLCMFHMFLVHKDLSYDAEKACVWSRLMMDPFRRLYAHHIYGATQNFISTSTSLAFLFKSSILSRGAKVWSNSRVRWLSFRYHNPKLFYLASSFYSTFTKLLMSSIMLWNPHV